MGYRIYVRDKSLNRIAEIDDFKSLNAVLKFNDVGTWTLDLPTKLASEKGLLDFSAGIVIVRDGQTLLSGPVTSINRSWSKDGDVVTTSGPDDNVWLQRRLAYPVPLAAPGQYGDSAYDVRTGPAETVMRQYVDVNLGPSAQSQRRVLGLTLAPDQGRGKTVTGRARFDNLLTLLQSLALAGGDLGFRVIQVGTGLQFEVYEPADKTATAIFSPALGNLQAFEYSQQAAEVNYVIVGGGGEDIARVFVEGGDSASITQYGRIEDFEDRRDTSDTAEMQQTITETLSQHAQQTSLSITPIDTDALQFGRDYGLGDKVSVVITGEQEVVDIQTVTYFLQASLPVEEVLQHIRTVYPAIDVIQDVIRGVTITLTPDQGEVIAPTVGTPDSLSANVPRIFADMRRIKARINNLERRL